MKKLDTNRFHLVYDERLEDFIKRSLLIVEEKLPLIKETLSCEEGAVGKLKASFFTQRKDFVDYIKSVSGKIPPRWATGCFYNSEIQTLIDINDKDDVIYKVRTLTHEMMHLYIQKLVYEKYNIDRIRWFDESYACYVDGSIVNWSKEEGVEIIAKLKSLGDFDVNILNDVNKVSTNEYNGYHMFKIIGKYIFENNLAKEYIGKIIENPVEIKEIGLTILKKAIKYFEEK